MVKKETYRSEFPTLGKAHKQQALLSNNWKQYTDNTQYKNTNEDFPSLQPIDQNQTNLMTSKE